MSESCLSGERIKPTEHVRLEFCDEKLDPRVFWRDTEVTTDCRSIRLLPFGECEVDLIERPAHFRLNDTLSTRLLYAIYRVKA